MGNLPRTASHERTASDEQLADDHASCGDVVARNIWRSGKGVQHGS